MNQLSGTPVAIITSGSVKTHKETLSHLPVAYFRLWTPER